MENQLNVSGLASAFADLDRTHALVDIVLSRPDDHTRKGILEDAPAKYSNLLLQIVRFCQYASIDFPMGVATVIHDAHLAIDGFPEMSTGDPASYHREMATKVASARRAILAHLWDQSFLYLPPQRAARLGRPEKTFDKASIEAFPSIANDVEHAGRCLAFREPTAAVFHLMRSMENVLRALAKRLGIPYQPSWEAYLGKMNEAFSGKYQTKTKAWRRHEPFYKGLAGDLLSVKHAWRNSTMHVERIYSEAEAEEIYNAVRLFIRHATTRLKEPKKRREARPDLT